MKCYFVPINDAYIVYRPLLPLAFVANAAMKDQIERWSDDSAVKEKNDAWVWLEQLGFWADDNSIDSYLDTDNTSPHTAVLLMTNGCNLRCTYCYANAGVESANSMPFELGRRLIDTAAHNAMRDNASQFNIVFHGGGEPTTHWQTLTEMVDYARCLPIEAHISMATNAVISTSRLKYVIQNFNELSISIDGIAEVHDSQRPTVGARGSFAAVMKTLALLDAASFRYGLRMTVTPNHFDTLPDAIDFLIENTSATGIQIEPAYLSQRGTHGEGGRDQGAEFSKYFLEALEIGIAKGRFIYYSGATPWRITDRFCRAATDALVATPEGDLVGCFEVHDRKHALIDDYRLGRVSENNGSASDDSMSGTIGHDPTLSRNFEDKHTQRRSSCEGCFCFYHCAGDCSILRPNGSTTLSTRCDVNRSVTSDILLRLIASSGGIWRGSMWSSSTTQGALS